MPAYYKIIGGRRYDRKLLETAEQLTEGRGDGRISQKDAEIIWTSIQDGTGITATEKRTVQYLIDTFNWSDKAELWIREQLDLRTETEDGERSIDHIIVVEFKLSQLAYQIDPADVEEQEQLPGNQIAFTDALRLALDTLLTSNSPRESPRYIIQEVFGLFPEEDPEAGEKITEHLREFLQQGELRLLPNEDWSDYDAEFDFNPPEERESGDLNWVFSLSLPTLSDHIYWIIVPRSGEEEAFIYGFN
jgi:OOP family OmpA-OmpF porin